MNPYLRDRVLTALGAVDTRHQKGKHRQESHGNDVGVGAGSGKLDRLKLVGRIQLDAGEELISSDKVDSDRSGLRVAWTRRSDGIRSLRLGVGGEGFGKRDTDNGLPAWSGNRDDVARINAERQLLRDELDRLDSADELTDAQAARLDELDDMNLQEVYGRGSTARLDETAASDLRDRLRTAIDAAAKFEAEENARFDEIDRLNAQLDRLDATGDDDWTPSLMAEHAEALRRIQELKASEPDRSGVGYFITGEGFVSGEWGDVHYEVFYDETAEVVLEVRPHDADPDWEMQGGESHGTFSVAEMRKVLTLLEGA